MKEAKQKYDSLIERVRAGEPINFGQMERVYAQAFLGKFLERLVSKPTKEKMDQMYGGLLEQDNLAETYRDEQASDEIHLSDSQLNSYSLELIGMMSGVLGVRASTQQLSPFIESALRHRDWELLEKTLALSEEGKMSKGVIEKVALEQLVNDRTDSYDELRQRFGEIQFNPEEVRDAYKLLIGKLSFDSVMRIKKETSIDVPQEEVQEFTENVLDPKNVPYNPLRGERIFKVLRDVVESTGKNPVTNEKLRESIPTYFRSAGAIDRERDIEDCNILFNLYHDDTLAPEVQLALIERGEIDLFKRVYDHSRTKISTDQTINVYVALENSTVFPYNPERGKVMALKGLDLISRVAIITGVAPSDEISTRVFTYLLDNKRLEEMEELSTRTRQPPTFNQETVEEILGNYAKTGGFSEFGKVVRIARKAKNKVNPDYVHDVARKYLAMYSEYSTDIREAISQVDKLYQDLRLKPSNEVTSAKIEGLMNDFRRKFESAEKQYSKEGF